MLGTNLFLLGLQIALPVLSIMLTVSFLQGRVIPGRKDKAKCHCPCKQP